MENINDIETIGVYNYRDGDSYTGEVYNIETYILYYDNRYKQLLILLPNKQITNKLDIIYNDEVLEWIKSTFDKFIRKKIRRE